jgi:hypothetical protein
MAVRVLPGLLGADGTRNYFVMFTTPSEARAAGGFMGNWAILTAADGSLSITRFGRSEDLNKSGDPAQKRISGPADYLRHYGQFSPATEWRSVNMSPDFPSVARVVGELYPQSEGTPIDGVIAVDPEGLAQFLRLTGPVRVPGRAEPLTADNAAAFLLRDQYLSFADKNSRVDFLEDAARNVTDAFTRSTLPRPRAIGDALGPAARGGHLRIASFDRMGERLFRRIGVAGQFGHNPGDYLAVVTQNASSSKLELFLHRTIDVRTRLDPETGRERTRMTVTLRNDAPTEGLPDYVIANQVPGLPTGWNRLYLSLYSHLDLRGATVDGNRLTMQSGIERGLNVSSALVTVPAGGQVVVEARFAGVGRLVGTGSRVAQQLTLWHQPSVNPDQAHVTLRLSDGWSFAEPSSGLVLDGGSATAEGPITADGTFRARLTD